MKATTELEKLLIHGEKMASKEVRRLVLQVFKRKPNVVKFSMGMGTWFFEDKNGNHVQTYHEHYQSSGNHAYLYTSKSWAKSINAFFEKYDETFKMTGEYMEMENPNLT